MATTIHFVRHGKPHNPRGIAYGRLPRIRLSEEGKQQARQAGRILRDSKPKALYASPLLRTRQTAKEIAQELGLTISISSKLIEVYTHLQGSTIEIMNGIKWNHYEAPTLQPGDETLEDVLGRLYSFCAQMEKRHPNQAIVAVTHGDPLMLIRAVGERLPLVVASIRPGQEKYIGYCEIVTVSVENSSIRLSNQHPNHV